MSFNISLIDAFQCAAKEMPEITITPWMMGGAPCIKDTRIPVYMVLDEIEHHGTIEGVLKSYPHLSTEQVNAALQFAKTVVECPLNDDETSSTAK